jgi:hypothetical protein
MKRIYLMAAGGGVLIALAVGFLVYTIRPEPVATADDLAKKAMESAKLEDRRTAAARLSTLGGESAVAQLDRLIKESKDPEVVALILPALVARKRDAQTVDLLFETLNNADKSVREVAFEELQTLVKIAPADKASFVPDDPASKREAAAKRLKEKYQKAPLR